MKTNFNFGSGTIVEIGDQEFILTAAHVLEHTHAGQLISIEGINWSVVWKIEKKLTRNDIALLSFSGSFHRQIFEIKISSKQAILSMDAIIAGFPAGRANYLDVGSEGAKETHMLPFLRKGIISAFLRKEFIIDCLIQRGFSGGPAFYVSADGKFTPHIFGVVSSGITFEDDQKLLDERTATTIRSGFTSCVSVDLALELAQDELGIMVTEG
ncbi:S1 family peptidase [Bosea sp. NPDC003192]|uniref:S1 family peptidase n=1 Tax=Bosea sp. NPDC003192 TaxID=3390551 RepID=UPI003D02D880